MLATRGAVYRTQRTAGDGNDYHRHCRCRAELETDFNAREDIAISQEDANRQIKFRGASRDYGYDMSQFRIKGVTDPPRVPTSAPVRGGAQRQAPGPWVDDPGKVRDALRGLGVKDDVLDGYMRQHHVITNGIDVIEAPAKTTSGYWVHAADRFYDVAKQKLDYRIYDQVDDLRYQISGREEMIRLRLARLENDGATKRQLSDYRRGRKVNGKADNAITEHLEAIKALQSELDNIQKDIERYKSWMFEYRTLKVRPVTADEIRLMQQMASDLDDVLWRIPSWRRYDQSGTQRGYALRLDSEGCSMINANAYTHRASNRVFIAEDTVSARVPDTSGMKVPAGGQPEARRVLAHEIGHTVDKLDNKTSEVIFARWKDADGPEWRAVSQYGRTKPSEMYAELFAEWVYGDRSNPAVAEFARVFKWAD
jgi:hypothetical protein